MPAEGGIAAVVLAAGASRRFGAENKLLASLEGATLIERVLDALSAAGITDLVVVTGCYGDAVERALQARPVHIVHNARWETGMGSSVATGVAAIDASAAAVFIVPGDMPLLTGELVSALIEAFERAGRDRIVFPATAEGEQRNPVLWPQRYFAALHALPDGAGAKALLQAASADTIALRLASDTVLADVDTAADLAALSASARLLRE